MNNEDESRALEQLYQTANNRGLMCEHRVLYEASIQPTDNGKYPLAVAVSLSSLCYIVFTITKRPLDEAGESGGLGFEFIAFFDNRDKAIQAVFSLIAK